MNIKLILSSVCFSLLSCQKKEKADKELELLSQYLVGSFTSEEQSGQDSAYHNIQLNVVPIWTDREDSKNQYWLYVEQSATVQLDRPYRQRVYRVYRSDKGQLISAIYLIKDPLRFAGHYRKERPLEILTIDSLELKRGCKVMLTRNGEVFTGATEELSCPSDLNGASYASSTVQLMADRLTSWDRGFDAEGNQVWGAVKGPYIFKRR